MRTFPHPIGESDKFFAAVGRSTNDDEDALLLIFEPGLQVNAIRPNVDVALRRQIALLPLRMVVLPAVLQAADRGRRQSACVFAEQRRQRLGEVAGRDPLEVEDRQQLLDRLRAPHVGRQDRRREADARGIAGHRLAIAHARLAHGDRPDAGHNLALGQVAVADDTLEAILSLEISMLAKEIRDLGLDGLGEQRTCPVAQDFGELVVKGSW